MRANLDLDDGDVTEIAVTHMGTIDAVKFMTKENRGYADGNRLDIKIDDIMGLDSMIYALTECRKEFAKKFLMERVE